MEEHMSWGDIFFGFQGRINRKIYWAGSVLVSVAGLLFAALLAYLATGNPLAPEVWQKPTDKASIWGPVWLAYFGFLVWPSTALAVKRLHDRSLPAWIWYLYYALALALSLVPLKASLGAEPNAAFSILGIPPDMFVTVLSLLASVLAFFTGYVFFELGVLRGMPGPNAHGEDPLPSGYYGGDYNSWSLMLALEGRISRAKWWLGLFVLISVIIVVSFALGLILDSVMASYPELQQHLNDPEWFNSREAEPIISSVGLWMIGPLLVIGLVMWSLFALGVKRLHDRGLSSWLILVVVLPFLGAAAAPTLAAEFELGENVVRLSFLLLMASVIWSVLQFGILKGETGPNEHGPDPLAG
jgi:uncharacterized membrane protein YhaH (DUF805 family)